MKKAKDIILRGEYFLHRKEKSSKIIYYHDLYDENHPALTNMATSLGLFKKHLDTLKDNGFEIVSKITEPYGQVHIAFDDGWGGLYYLKNYLIENKVFPTISVPVGLIGLDGYLSKRQIIELYELGFGIASHSWTHQSITLYNNNEDALAREIIDSKKYLEDLISAPVDIFCYPKGIFSKSTYIKTIEAGYKEIYSCVEGAYKDDLFPNVKRRCLAQYATLNELQWLMMGPNKIMSRKHFKEHFSNK